MSTGSFEALLGREKSLARVLSGWLRAPAPPELDVPGALLGATTGGSLGIGLPLGHCPKLFAKVPTAGRPEKLPACYSVRMLRVKRVRARHEV